MIDSNVEIRRLAALMHCNKEDLNYLLPLSGEGIMRLRMQFQDSLIDDFAPALSKLAATASITPTAISEKICVRYLGPTLTGYLAYFTSIKSATKLAKRLDADFLIELSKELVPERVKDLLANFPPDLMRPVTQGLVEDCAWETMGGFVDYLPPETSLALIEDVPDPIACLWISSFAQNKELIAEVVSEFSDEMLIGLVSGSLTRPELMREICVIAEHLPEESLEQISRIKPLLSAGKQKKLRSFAEQNGFDALAAQYA
jgi:hypothetical protein